METRPNIKLTPLLLDNIIEWTGRIFLVGMWGLMFYAFSKLPATIPIHFNGSGEPDRYGDKKTLFILPALATLLYVGLTLLNRFTRSFNYLAEITKDNARRQYTIAARTLGFIKVAILLIFSLIILFTYLTTIGVTKGLGSWFVPLTFALLSVPVIIIITQALKEKNNTA